MHPHVVSLLSCSGGFGLLQTPADLAAVSSWLGVLCMHQ